MRKTQKPIRVVDSRRTDYGFAAPAEPATAPAVEFVGASAATIALGVATWRTLTARSWPAGKRDGTMVPFDARNDWHLGVVVAQVYSAMAAAIAAEADSQVTIK